MGLKKDEFFALTPRAFFKMHDTWVDGQRDLHRMVALLRVDMINHSMYRPARPLELADLMPSAAGRPAQAPRRRRLTKKFRAEIAERCRQVFGAYAAPEAAVKPEGE